MLLPKKVKRYCPYCGKHTVHEIERVKKKKASELKQGQRRFRRVTRGYGGFPRPKPSGREKTSRRMAIRYRCTVCGKRHHAPTIRTKRLEIGEG
ncbi:MAG: 50S ribosomal protein L44e [Thermoplasmata archaeon]|nr:50S ribosomal protein L44e [Thermoplasmata archaeon]RLF27640.1 MAG: 50S ribosomal protein L44e [Thermoplasmata archaeon]HHH79287.1 50S ribosomal protein L44e [Thermoplasmatales archaeon]